MQRLGLAIAILIIVTGLYVFYKKNNQAQSVQPQQTNITISTDGTDSTNINLNNQWKIVAMRPMISHVFIDIKSDYLPPKWGRTHHGYEHEGQIRIKSNYLVIFENLSNGQRLTRILADDTNFIIGDICQLDNKRRFYRITQAK